MGYFLLELFLFLAGLAEVLLGKVPLPRGRRVNGTAARWAGAILMIPLPLYLIACKQAHVPALGPNEPRLDPLAPVTQGFVRLAALMAAFASVLAATVLVFVTSEPRRRP